MSNNHISLRGVMDVAIFLLLTATVLSHFGEYHYLFELFSHLKNLYLATALAFFAVLCFLKNKTGVLLTSLCILINGWAVVPLYFAADASSVSDSGPQIKLLLSNVYTQNPHHQKLVDLVLQETPDVLVLQEVNTLWIESLTPLFEHYPHRISEPRNDNFGIAVFSKIEPMNQEITHWGSIELPSVESRFQLDGNVFHLLATHPLPPISELNYQFRNQQLFEVSQRVQQLDSATLVVGDLNITPWSLDYQSFEAQTRLRNVRNGFGILPTWPAQIPLLRIPIDHVLISKEFSVDSVKTGPNIGSDHLPLVVTLSLTGTR